MRSLTLALLASPLLLTACGEGYELIRTDTMFPYGNQRTAGSGVAYVLAKMMPEKNLNLESEMVPVHREMQPRAISNEETLTDIREMFSKTQRK